MARVAVAVSLFFEVSKS